jgi:hypothetical protein
VSTHRDLAREDLRFNGSVDVPLRGHRVTGRRLDEPMFGVCDAYTEEYDRKRFGEEFVKRHYPGERE